MPKIPVYGGQQVGDAPIRGPRVPTDAPLSNFGGGPAAENAMGAASQLGQDVADRAAYERRKAYSSAVETMANENAARLSREETKLKTTLQGIQGSAALKASADATAGLEKFYNEIDGRIENPDVKRLTGAHYARFRDSLGSFAEQYAAHQSRVAERQASEAVVQSELNAVMTDPSPERIGQALEQITKTIDSFGQPDKGGLPPQAVALAKAETVSRLHANVLDGMLSRGLDLVAKDYLQAHERELLGNDAKRLGRMVRNENILAEAQRRVDAIFSTQYTKREEEGVTIIDATYTPESEEEAMDRARSIKDPDVRAKAEELTRQRWAGLKRSEEEGRKRDMQDAANQLDAGRAYDQLPPALKDRLSPTQRKQLMAYAKGDVVTKDADWYALQLMAAQPDTRDAFKKLNLMGYATKLSRSDLQEVMKLQTGLIKDDAKAKRDADGFRGTASIVEGTIQGKINPDEKEPFLRVVNEKVRLWKAEKKTDFIPDEQVQYFADEMLKESIRPGVLGMTWGPFGTKERQYARQAKIATFASTNVPRIDRDYIVGEFKRKGILYDDLMIIEAYFHLAKQRAEGTNAHAGK